MTESPSAPKSVPAVRRDEARAERLSAALRANLARRKAQQRARDAGDTEGAAGSDTVSRLRQA